MTEVEKVQDHCRNKTGISVLTCGKATMSGLKSLS